jgi:hypothetical protein
MKSTQMPTLENSTTTCFVQTKIKLRLCVCVLQILNDRVIKCLQSSRDGGGCGLDFYISSSATFLGVSTQIPYVQTSTLVFRLRRGLLYVGPFRRNGGRINSRLLALSPTFTVERYKKLDCSYESQMIRNRVQLTGVPGGGWPFIVAGFWLETRCE